MHFGEYYSEGCRLLLKHINGNNNGNQPVEQKDFAEKSGITAAFLNHLLYGRKRPSVKTAVKINQASGGFIPVEAWTQPRKPQARKEA